jgi:hypothetical protein
MGMDLVIKHAQEHVLFWLFLHSEHGRVPLVQKRRKIVVLHAQVLEHTDIVHPNIGRGHVEMPVYHPEKLPSLHQTIVFRHLTLSQRNLQLELALKLVLKSDKELLVKGAEITTVSKLLKRGVLFPNLLNPLKCFLRAAGRSRNSTTDAHRPVREGSRGGQSSELDLVALLLLHASSDGRLGEMR